jgi:sulfate/thiosulfate transport system permease protein
VLTALFIVTPLAYIFVQAFSRGVEVYAANILAPDDAARDLADHARRHHRRADQRRLRHRRRLGDHQVRFPGRSLLVTLIEIPFSISPIVAGVTYLLLYGRAGPARALADRDGHPDHVRAAGHRPRHDVRHRPFVVRELVPLMQVQGSEQEEAAVTLGANGWQIFRRVTLPNIRWALLYGAVLCTARAIGEFGAVSVVSGKIRGQTNTLPLQVELLFNDSTRSAPSPPPRR